MPNYENVLLYNHLGPTDYSQNKFTYYEIPKMKIKTTRAQTLQIALLFSNLMPTIYFQNYFEIFNIPKIKILIPENLNTTKCNNIIYICLDGNALLLR